MSSKRKTAKSHINRINEEEFVKPNGGYGWIILILAFVRQRKKKIKN